jgi:phosphoglycerol transferase MdoB-like AlkP superfamily enzyme
MTNASTIILLPFLIAFLVFIFRFYGKENAGSKLNLSFLLAFATVAAACAYLALGVTKMLPEYGTMGFAVVGMGLMVFSIYRLFSL